MALVSGNDVRVEADAPLSPDEINAAYAWVEWPQREPGRLEAVTRRCTWFAARAADGGLVGVARLLDDGGLHASLWDVIVRPDHQRRGVGRALVEAALERCRDRRLVALVSTPAAVAFFAEIGFVPESHGHVAMYLRPHRPASGAAADEPHGG
ncbi:MAG TPA: GNAT family N-acetyltransferase [Candidatus Limnocylindria bacterium]|nr:GNAT family N-acetyltransferase [Candidatus Limnocylindria bacterium]